MHQSRARWCVPEQSTVHTYHELESLCDTVHGGPEENRTPFFAMPSRHSTGELRALRFATLTQGYSPRGVLFGVGIFYLKFGWLGRLGAASSGRLTLGVIEGSGAGEVGSRP